MISPTRRILIAHYTEGVLRARRAYHEPTAHHCADCGRYISPGDKHKRCFSCRDSRASKGEL